MERASEKPDVSFQEAVDFAQTREVTAEEVRAMRTDSTSTRYETSTPVNMLSQRRGDLHQKSSRQAEGKRKPCFRCGNQHDPQDCWFRSTKCRSCSKVGHIERVCHSKKNTEMESRDKGQKYRSNKHRRDVHKVDTKAKSREDVASSSSESDVGEVDDEFHFTMMMKDGDENNPAYVAKMKVDSKIIDMEVDTGSSVSMIP